MPIGIIYLDGCCCPEGSGSGSGSGDGALYFTITCLDSVCGAVNAQYTCPSSTMPNNWCVDDFGTTNPSSQCQFLFDTTGINLVGGLCFDICSWGTTSLVNPGVTVGNCPGAYEINMAPVCLGDNPLSISGGAAPDNGIMMGCQINLGGTIAKAQYFIAADDFDCTGSNVMILLATEASTNENWAASIVISPCAPDPNNPSLCE